MFVVSSAMGMESVCLHWIAAALWNVGGSSSETDSSGSVFCLTGTKLHLQQAVSSQYSMEAKHMCMMISLLRRWEPTHNPPTLCFFGDFLLYAFSWELHTCMILWRAKRDLFTGLVQIVSSLLFAKQSSYLSVLHVSFGNVDCRHKRLWLWLVQMDDRGAQPTHRDLQQVSQILQQVRIRGCAWRKTKTKLLERVLVGVV